MGVLVRSFCVLAIAACGGEEAARSLATSPAVASPASAGSSSPEDAADPSSVRTLTGASLSGPHATRCAALQSHRALRERPEPPCEQLEASASGDRLDTVLARFGPSGPFEDVELVVVELGETDAPEGGECVLVARHEGRWYRDDLGDLCSNRGTARLSVEPTFSSLPSGRVRLDLLLRDEHERGGQVTSLARRVDLVERTFERQRARSPPHARRGCDVRPCVHEVVRSASHRSRMSPSERSFVEERTRDRAKRRSVRREDASSEPIHTHERTLGQDLEVVDVDLTSARTSQRDELVDRPPTLRVCEEREAARLAHAQARDQHAKASLPLGVRGRIVDQRAWDSVVRFGQTPRLQPREVRVRRRREANRALRLRAFRRQRVHEEALFVRQGQRARTGGDDTALRHAPQVLREVRAPRVLLAVHAVDDHQAGLVRRRHGLARRPPRRTCVRRHASQERALADPRWTDERDHARHPHQRREPRTRLDSTDELHGPLKIERSTANLSPPPTKAERTSRPRFQWCFRRSLLRFDATLDRRRAGKRD